MEKILIKGGKALHGQVEVMGAKNAALGIIPATILAGGYCSIKNVPDISDIRNYISIMEKLGAVVSYSGDRLDIDTTFVDPANAGLIDEEATNMRASYYLLGALLARFGTVRIAFPGGCDIGARPIDFHIEGFQALGATVIGENSDYIEIHADRLIGCNIDFAFASVGATINIMLAAVTAEGETVINNAAREPHVEDIANYLNCCGALITGAGTSQIRITGVKSLHAADYSIVPDQITAGTYMICAAATKGDVTVTRIIPEHLGIIAEKLIQMGCDVLFGDDYVRVIGNRPLKAINLETMPYPGFPTDLQQPMGVLMCLAEGDSIIDENIFENRFRYLEELNKMGAKTRYEGSRAYISGVASLKSDRIHSTDLRAGAAMLIAGLAAEGTTEITDLQHIDRGYDRIVEKLLALGSDIVRINEGQ
ncbi:MAG: UDP-N-acetylglucosamine 1-carboxyvinyltransferase [Eubacteriaceae bacterium]|jgi:UDP-N-acetylglucosamine 1-carboxyvinyltransferase|nr:UDP-N-acetylglucosamine 1-carboxyvinyltransferase [Eubacteriaceae bacterium]